MRRPLRLVVVGALGLAALLVLPSAARGAAIVESAYSRVAHSGSVRSPTARERTGAVSAVLTQPHPPPEPPELTDDRGPDRAQDRSYPGRDANPIGREMMSAETWSSDADSGAEGLDEGVGASGRYIGGAYHDSQRDRNLSPETSKMQQGSHESESSEDSYGANGIHRRPSTNNLVDSAGVGRQVDASEDTGSYVVSESRTPQRHTFGNVERIDPGDEGGQIVDVLTPPNESDPPSYWEDDNVGKGGEEESETGHYDSPGEQEDNAPTSTPAQSVMRKEQHRLSYVKEEEVPKYANDDTNEADGKSHVPDTPHYDDNDDDDDNDNDGEDNDNDDEDNDNDDEDDDADNNEDDNVNENDSEQDNDVARGDVTTPPMPTDAVPPASDRKEAEQRSESEGTGHDRELKQEPQHQKQKQESRLKRPSYAGYYGLGRKLWYVPLWFSVYYIIYLTALVIKSIARHKIQYPETEKHHGWDKRSLANVAGEALVRTVHRALRAAASKYD